MQFAKLIEQKTRVFNHVKCIKCKDTVFFVKQSIIKEMTEIYNEDSQIKIIR